MNNTLHSASLSSGTSLVAACSVTCKKLLSRIHILKRALLSEFRQAAFPQDRLVQLALNEAEALAYETGFPQLTFPVLALEKVQEVAAWRLQQHRVRRELFQKLAA